MSKKGCTEVRITKVKIAHKAKSKCSTDDVESEPEPKKSNSKGSPRFMRLIGPKQINILSLFAPSAITYGITSVLCICYFTEWKAVLQYVPLYRGKYFQPTQPKKNSDDC